MLNLKYLILLFLISFSFQDQNCLITFKECEYTEPTKEIKIQHCTDHYFDEDGENEIEKCNECENGYVVSNDYKSCEKVQTPTEHCIRYDRSGEYIYCDRCENNYVYSRGDNICVKFEYCNYLEDKEHCGSCKEGYALSYDKTSCISFKNCYQLDKGNSKCNQCYSQYHQNSNGQCELTLCKSYSDNVCTDCYGGYYLNDKKECQKITIANCLQLDDSKKKCSTCLAGITPDNDGNCNLPSKLIEGCVEYENNGNCKTCDGNYDLSTDGKKCDYDCTGGKSYEYCGICKPGYTDDVDGFCIGYDGSKDTSFSRTNQVRYASLLFILVLLI
jgi:hypothetical protein